MKQYCATETKNDVTIVIPMLSVFVVADTGSQLHHLLVVLCCTWQAVCGAI